MKAVTATRTDRLAALFQDLEVVAADLTAGKLLDAIGRTARLDAVLRARYAALEASVPAPAPAPLPDEPRYLDAVAAGAYLGVSRSTVLRLVAAKKLIQVQASAGVVRFDKVDLDSFMARSRR